MDINKPETFGEPAQLENQIGMTAFNLFEEAPAPDPNRTRPAVRRLLQADGANLIVFSFAPGQNLPDHKAAHPITVQCIAGELEFGCGEETVQLEAGRVVHLSAYVPHSVSCPATAPGRNILLLTMLTGEKH